MEFSALENFCSQLKEIKTGLIKLNKDRRKPEILERKLEEAQFIYKQIGDLISQIGPKVKEKFYDEKQVILIKQTYDISKGYFEDIKKFCKENIEIYQTENTNTETVMSNFDIKVAVSLLPLMNDTEATTSQLIDAIELYSSMLDNIGKSTLIKFVLKTKLSASAKLRLASQYDTVENLVSDMKTHLLTKKSDTALQSKLARARQGEKSIEDFGKELEELFVDLTISQANGDENAYSVLKPLNEKMAVKRFADGLRNQKLSTIIASRNFNALKDAIRAAQDEETPRVNEGQAMFFSRRGRGNFRGSNRAQNGRSRFNNTNRGRHNNNNSRFSRTGNNSNRGNNRFQNNQNRSSSNYSSRSNNRNRQNNYNRNNNVNYIEQQGSSHSVPDNENELNYFFRENDDS